MIEKLIKWVLLEESRSTLQNSNYKKSLREVMRKHLYELIDIKNKIIILEHCDD